MWVALSTIDALYAQARARAPDRPDTAMDSGVQDARSFKEIPRAYPCPWSMEDHSPHKWWNTAWNTICIERARSQAVALAWAHGLDERGMQLDAVAHARKLSEMEVWLRRLAGRFRIEGMRWNASGGRAQVRGTADCFGIGSGPEVTCLISAIWKSGKENAKDLDQTSYFAVRPQVLLFGLDPGAMEIRVTHVDDVAVGMRGFLLNGAVILDAQSPPGIRSLNHALVGVASNPFTSVASESKGRVLPKPLSRVAIKPGGDVDMKFHVYPPDMVTFWNQPIEFDLQLYREPQVDTVRPRVAP
jgi:hypothetical protein